MGAIANFVARIDMVDLVGLQGTIGKMKRTFGREVVRENSWAVQRGIDGDDSVAGGEVFHGGSQVGGYATNT